MFASFKKIWLFAQKERSNINKSVLANIFYALFSMLEITSIYFILTRLIQGSKALSSSIIVVIILLVSVLGKASLKYISQLSQTHASYFMVAKKRIDIAAKLRKIPMGYFNQNSLGKITAISTSVLDTVEMLSARVLVLALGGLINALVFAALVLIYDYRIGALVIIATTIYLAIAGQMEKKSAQIAPHREKSQSKMVESILEYVQGMAVVKSFNLQGRGDKAVAEALDYNCQSNLKIEALFTPYQIVQSLVLRFFLVLIILTSVYFHLNASLALVDTLMMIILSFSVFKHTEGIGSAITYLRLVSSSIEEVSEIETISEMDEQAKSSELENLDIEFKDVNFSYESKKILDQFSLKIKQNTKTAIVGASGSGKTTVCNLLARFWDVDSGEISLGSKNIKDLSLDLLMSKISMVFQDVYLFADTIENNIKFGKPDASLDEVIEAAKRAACHDFIMKLPNAYQTVLSEAGASISGGEKQRISIARALIKNAPIVILDEATANVDPENEDKLEQAIFELCCNKTIIMIAHRLKTVQTADQIVVMDQGKIVQLGKHQDLAETTGIYQDFIAYREEAKNWKIKEKK